MMWILVIVFGVVAMLVGPVSLLRPNPTEQRLEALRAEARRLGLVVRLRRAPGADSNDTRLLSVYALPGACARHWRLICCDYEHPLHLAGYWQLDTQTPVADSERQQLAQVLESLPPGVERVDTGATGVYAEWRERGGRDELLRLHHGLSEMQALAAVSEPG